MEELLAQIKVVAESREQALKAMGDKNSSYAEWEVENIPILDRVKVTAEELKVVEAQLRTLTLQAYKETGNKAPAEGVGIREVTKLEYDTKEAFNWGIEHKLALTLDKKAFEVIAKTSGALDFVTVTQEPQATIATQLEGGI